MDVNYDFVMLKVCIAGTKKRVITLRKVSASMVGGSRDWPALSFTLLPRGWE